MTVTEFDELKSYFKNHCKTRELAAHTAKVHTVDWNCDGRRLASGSFDKTVCLFTVEHDRLVIELLLYFAIELKIFPFHPQLRLKNKHLWVIVTVLTSSVGMKQVQIF